MTSRRAAAAAILLAVFVAGGTSAAGFLLGPTPTSLAFLTDTATSTGTTTAGTLDPPTNLAATANGLQVTLTWTASPDAADADGYQVHRANAIGGPFTQVGTATPGTATTTVDTAPSGGTWYYLLKTYAGGAPWISVATGEASVVVSVVTTTPWTACTTNAPLTARAGDNDGYETSAAEACDDDSVPARDVDSGTSTAGGCGNPGKDKHRFGGFALGLPVSVTAIHGIEVRTDMWADATVGRPMACVRLSWDGGTTWTGYVNVGGDLTTTETTYTLGSAADLWGRTAWTPAELGSSAFLVEVTDSARNGARDFSLDGLAVRVTYTP